MKRFIQKTDEEAATGERVSQGSYRAAVWAAAEEYERPDERRGSEALERERAGRAEGGAVIGNQANRQESPPDEASRQLERSRVASQTKQRGRLSLPWL